MESFIGGGALVFYPDQVLGEVYSFPSEGPQTENRGTSTVRV